MQKADDGNFAEAKYEFFTKKVILRVLFSKMKQEVVQVAHHGDCC